jgi:hypothetical protein
MQKYSIEGDLVIRAFSLSLSPERQLVSDVTADEGFLCDTTNAL